MPEESDTETLHLRVTVGDITVEAEGPIDDAETWFESLREDYLSEVDTETLEAAGDGANVVTNGAGTQQETETDSNRAQTRKSRSLPEFYKQAADMTKRDAALFVGWHLEYQEDKDDFTKPEVEERAKDAKIDLGANVSRDLSNQVGDGRLQKTEERDGKDAYQLTLTGEEYVQDELLANLEH